MNYNITKSYNKIIGGIVALALAIPMQAMAAMPALFYTSSFDAEVGDIITFDLKVNPSNPTYTVGATLHYDPSLLTFVSAETNKNWTPLSRPPYELTDTKNGIVQRTAGYAEGVTGVTPFTHYTFKAKAVGDAVVTIKEGISFDADNNDSGIQKKEITVRIGEATKPSPKSSNTDNKPANKKVEIMLNLTGATAHVMGNNYILSAILNGTDEDGDALTTATPTMGTTTVTVVNRMGQAVYNYNQPFNTIDATTTLQFAIPQTVLLEGDYSIVAEVKYDGAKKPVVVTKDIGVLSKQVEEKIITVIPDYMWPVIIGLSTLLVIAGVVLYGLKKNQKKGRSK